jgi:putative DNA primase/helicase
MTFAEFAVLYGLVLPDLYPSEQVRRCPTEQHPRKKDGAYFWDGRRGWVSDWSNGAEIHWYDNPDAKGFTEADKRAWAERKRAQERRQAEVHRQAERTAADMLRACRPAEHTYLSGKQLHGVLGLVNDERELLVPMRALDSNALIGAQVIKWLMDERTWQKKMIFGSRAKGAVFRLGNPRAPEIWLVEGYATGLTIELALRQLRLPAQVLICFSASNLTYVAGKLKGRKFAFADHDKSGTGERAAQQAGLHYCMSEVEGEDANDMYVRVGLVAVSAVILATRRKEQL